MALTTGTRLGSYEITAQIGAGGMGEVYRATDTKLDRAVAIKVLPESFARDTDRVARFTREAKTLAALNHPNIAQVFGIEEQEATRALVMELVEGEDLSQVIARGPIAWADALPLARQIADALEAAHEQGIIHRDLKPANIKVRADGTVKVLDFGLAKAMLPDGSGATSGASALTLTSPAVTEMGMILGTAAYMAPEQARGRAVDKRADIWAFGVVLYEMLTGRRAFDGEDVSITLAAVLKDEIDWQALPDDLPPPLRRLLRRSLERDPRRRLSSMADARLELDDATTEPREHVSATAHASAPATPSRLPWVVAAVMATAAVVAITLWRPWHTPPPAPRVTFELPPPAGADAFGQQMAISPDGRYLVTRIRTSAGGRAVDRRADIELWLHSFETNSGEVLPGTRNAAAAPFWSPDSRHIGFFADRKLKRLDIGGSAPANITDVDDGRGASWNADDVIIFGVQSEGPLRRVPAGGGTPVAITTVDTAAGEVAHRFPTFLPDGVHYVYLVVHTQSDRQGIYLGALGSDESTLLTPAATAPVFGAPDQLLFERDGRLMAQRLDLSQRALVDQPRPVSDSIGTAGSGALRVDATGTMLVYQADPDAGLLQMGWMNPDGTPGAAQKTLALYDNPRLSPDGTKAAVSLPETGGGDIWILDLERDTKARFTFDEAFDGVPLWSPDGKQLAFVSSRDGGILNIYVKSSGGTGQDELLLRTDRDKWLNDWSADGRYLLYQERAGTGNGDLWALPLFGDRQPIPLVTTPFSETLGAFSPDGRWFAYASDEGGFNQVYLQTFPVSGTKWLVSPDRGWAPRWQADGKRLFYDRTGEMTAVDLLELTTERLRTSKPQPLFRGLISMGPHNYDIAADGRFLVLTRPSAARLASVTVVQNWQTPLR